MSMPPRGANVLVSPVQDEKTVISLREEANAVTPSFLSYQDGTLIAHKESPPRFGPQADMPGVSKFNHNDMHRLLPSDATLAQPISPSLSDPKFVGRCHRPHNNLDRVSMRHRVALLPMIAKHHLSPHNVSLEHPSAAGASSSFSVSTLERHRINSGVQRTYGRFSGDDTLTILQTTPIPYYRDNTSVFGSPTNVNKDHWSTLSFHWSDSTVDNNDHESLRRCDSPDHKPPEFDDDHMEYSPSGSDSDFEEDSFPDDPSIAVPVVHQQ